MVPRGGNQKRTRYCLTKARTLRTLASMVLPIRSQKYSLICGRFLRVSVL